MVAMCSPRLLHDAKKMRRLMALLKAEEKTKVPTMKKMPTRDRPELTLSVMTTACSWAAVKPVVVVGDAMSARPGGWETT